MVKLEDGIVLIQQLSLSLVDGGWLIVSPSEASQALFFSQLSPVRFPDAILYRKEARGKRATPGPQAVEASPSGQPFLSMGN